VNLIVDVFNVLGEAGQPVGWILWHIYKSIYWCFVVRSDRTKNSTRQLHESIVVMWLCKCECRTHRESALLKTNFKMPKLKIP
jgi:hypothetical protein